MTAAARSAHLARSLMRTPILTPRRLRGYAAARPLSSSSPILRYRSLPGEGSRCLYSRSYATQGSTPTGDTASSNAAPLCKTPLYDLHVERKAKLVPFAGYEMPLTYQDGGQLKEHAEVRNAAGLFDVSHMVQSVVEGDGATKFMEYLLPASLDSLLLGESSNSDFKNTSSVEGPFLSSLSVMLNENGGIIDDLLVTRQGQDKYYVVTNAGRREEDSKHMHAALQEFNSRNATQVTLKTLENQGLLALQGPKSASVLQSLIEDGVDLSKLYFGRSIFANLNLPGSGQQVRVHIARGGYTGEDGFEISVDEASSIPVAKALLDGPEPVRLIGLAARDSLRLEAGMCLYGNDLTEDVGPFEASLAWVVGSDRRSGSKASFIGAKPTLEAIASKKSPTKRVGLLIEAGPSAREGTRVYAKGSGESDEPIGSISSGIPSPTLKQNIAMAYVKWGHHKIGTELEVRLRNKTKQAKVVSMPFVPSNYHRAPKA